MSDTRTCRQPAGEFMPVINRNRCEGKADCAVVCPYGVFTIGWLSPEQRRSLTLVGKLNGWAHGWQQAFVIDPSACRACGLCVAACPEGAVRLVRHGHNESDHASTAAH